MIPIRKNFHIYLLAGQSNMAGNGRFDEEAKAPNPRVLKFTGKNTWEPGLDPLNDCPPDHARVGLGTTFGRVMAGAAPEVTVGLVQSAVGGTPLSRWIKGSDLYEQAVTRTRLAMKDGELKGILWHQGEADSYRQDDAESYGVRLAQMVTDLRADLGVGDVPFVAGQLGLSLAEHLGNKHGRMEYWHVVNDQLATLSALVPNVAVAISAGLSSIGDHVHFDSPSLREFGRRYAGTMLQLQIHSLECKTGCNA